MGDRGRQQQSRPGCCDRGGAAAVERGLDPDPGPKAGARGRGEGAEKRDGGLGGGGARGWALGTLRYTFGWRSARNSEQYDDIQMGGQKTLRTGMYQKSGRRGGGEGGSEGEGGRGVWLGPPPSSQGPRMVPAAGGANILKRKSSWHRKRRSKILLPSARHLEEGRGTTEAGKLLCPSPLGTPPPQNPNRVKNT